MQLPTLFEYGDLFVQRHPHYVLKSPGTKGWRCVKSKEQPFADKVVSTHLRGIKDVASLGKWYPAHAVLDIDERDVGEVEEIRDKLGLNNNNSFLCESESPNSWHVIFRPIYNKKPPTLRLLDAILKPFTREHGIEIFPQARKACRLPFGPRQGIVIPGYELIKKWEEKLYWFTKLDEYDLVSVPSHQIYLPLDDLTCVGRVSAYSEGRELLDTGLQASSTRNESQFQVLYYLWRQNVPIDMAESVCWQWIQKMHNGFSSDIRTNPRQVKKEIGRQASCIWSHYSLPDGAHNHHFGYLAKDDIGDIFGTVRGSLPKARFLFGLVKFFYPRRLRKESSVHTNLLVQWSSRDTYLKRIEELRSMGLVERGNYYQVKGRAKEIALNWNYKHPEGRILVDDRAPDSLETTIQAVLEPEETRAILKASDVDKRHLSQYLKSIYEYRGHQNSKHIINNPTPSGLLVA